MRILPYVVALACAFGANVAGQASAKQLPAEAKEILGKWEKATSSANQLICKVQRESFDQALNARQSECAPAFFLGTEVKDGTGRRRLDMVRALSPTLFSTEFRDAENHRPEGVLRLLFGMSVDRANARFEVRIVEPKLSDDKYHYLRLTPKLDADKADFVEVRVSLFKSNHLPAQVSLIHRNRNCTTWAFSELRVDK